jgi:hypothetical protein
MSGIDPDIPVVVVPDRPVAGSSGDTMPRRVGVNHLSFQIRGHEQRQREQHREHEQDLPHEDLLSRWLLQETSTKERGTEVPLEGSKA